MKAAGRIHMLRLDGRRGNRDRSHREACGHGIAPAQTWRAVGRRRQWAFSDTGAPSGRHPVISTSYTHGRGTWAGGPATGTACSEDTLTTDPAQHELTVAGNAELSPGIIELGSPGIASSCQ